MLANTLLESGSWEGLTSSSAQSTTASFTFEMLSFLMIDENFEIIEIALTVVTPRTRKDLIQVRVIALLLRHLAQRCLPGCSEYNPQQAADCDIAAGK